MQMVKKVLLFLVVIWFFLILLMPKVEFYYALEKELAKYDVKLNEQQIDSGAFSLDIKDIDIYVKGVEVAHLDRLSISTLLFYTHSKLEKLTFSSFLKGQVPDNIESIDIYHKIVNPLVVSMDANGSFGEARGKLSLATHKVRVNLVKTEDISSIKSFLKKDKKGWYYEKSF